MKEERKLKKFDITFFYGPTSEYIVKEECIADMAASGITLCQLFWNDTNTIKEALPILKKYGLGAIVHDCRINEVYQTGKPEYADAVVREVVEDYASFDNIVEFGVCDEPDSEKFPVVAAIVEAFRRYLPEKETAINLFPDYATADQLKAVSYDAYLKDFVEIVKPHFLSYDYYQFLGRPSYQRDCEDTDDERELLIRQAAQGTEDRDGFFDNLRVIRELGIEKGLEQMLIVQLVEHADCRNLTYSEILWEVNMCLVYGMHRISYFTYWLPDDATEWYRWDNAMCDMQGNKYQHYYDVQAVNREIIDIGQILFETKLEEVFHLGDLPKGTVLFTGYADITEIIGEDAVVGFFENGMIFLVNRDFRHVNRLKICADRELKVYKSGQFLPCGATYEVVLRPGEGVLLR